MKYLILLSVWCLLTLSQVQATNNEETVKEKILRLKTIIGARAAENDLLRPQQHRDFTPPPYNDKDNNIEIDFDQKNPRRMDDKFCYIKDKEIIFAKPKRLLSLPEKLEKNQEQDKPNRAHSSPELSKENVKIKTEAKAQNSNFLIFEEILN